MQKLYKPFYDPEITPKKKKYSVYVKGINGPKLIHFGDRSMQHYRDKIGYWSNLDHLDNDRRRRYLSRAKGIKNKEGKLTWKDKNSSNYYSVHYLW